MQTDLEKTAAQCQQCQLNKPTNRNEPMLAHKVPIQQFAKVGTDVMYHRGAPYLILVDYMSDFIEVTKLVDEAASTVVEACKEVFASHGIPCVLHSDNAPYYVSSKFKEFATDWRFEHTTSSPYHSRSNGKAESAVKIIKNILRKAEDPWKAILEWRSAPNNDFRSPAERLYSRRLRTMVPQPAEAMRVQRPDLDEIATARTERQKRMTGAFNKSTKELDKLQIGQPVLLRQVNDRVAKWREAQVIEPLSNRSYLIRNDLGNIVRRNRVDIQAPPPRRNVPSPIQERRKEGHTSKSNDHPQGDQDIPPVPTISRCGRQIVRPIRPEYKYY